MAKDKSFFLTLERVKFSKDLLIKVLNPVNNL